MKQANGKTYQLTAVDLEILQLVSTYHYLTCEQIVRLRYSPNSVPTCQIRMKALFENGWLLRTRLPSLSTGNSSFVYHISQKAEQLFEDVDTETLRRIRKDDIEALQYPFLSHCLSLNDVLIAATQLSASVPSISIEWQHELTTLKKSPLKVTGERRLTSGRIVPEEWKIVPDAWLDARMTGREKARRRCICFELDRATTSVTPFRQKIRGYYWLALSSSYQEIFKTNLCIAAWATTGGDKRLAQMLDWCESELQEQGLEREANLYRFTALPAGEYNPQELFCSEMWYKPFEEKPVPLLWSV